MGEQEYSYFKDKGGIMAEAVEHLWTLSADETLQELAMVKERHRKDQVAREQYVYEKGMKKGRQEGEQKGRQEAALKLIEKDMTIQEVCEITGLSEEEIHHICKSK